MKKRIFLITAPIVITILYAYTAWQLPSDYFLHVSEHPSRVTAEDFDAYSRWYNVIENNTVQVFTMWGENNGVFENEDGRARVETWAPTWKATSKDDWHYFEARFRMEIPGENQSRAIFQMKSPDPAVEWELHINYNEKDEIILNHRRLADEILDTDMRNKVFALRVASNGREYMVWYNGNLVSHVPHQIDPSGNSWYAFRWGMYTQNIVANTKMYAWNVRYGTMTPPNQKNPIVVISKRNAPGFALSSYNANRNNNNIFLWNKQLYNVNEQWEEINRGNGYYSYRRIDTNLCLDGGNGGANRQNVFIYPCSASNQNQHWQKIDAGSGYYRLQKRNASDYSIDGGNGGANLQNTFLWPNRPANQNQHWKFDIVGHKSTLTTAVIDTDTSQFLYELYPNPSKDYFNLSFPSVNFTKAEIRISDLSGKTVLTKNLENFYNQIDIHNLKNGLYMVRILKDGQVSNIKLIKK